jgi:hypothetical protein
MSRHNMYRAMSNEINIRADAGEPVVYQIRLKGHLGCTSATVTSRLLSENLTG